MRRLVGLVVLGTLGCGGRTVGPDQVTSGLTDTSSSSTPPSPSPSRPRVTGERARAPLE